MREGDTVSVPVLDNDTMADGIPLKVDPASVTVVSKGDAQRAFASGNVIRYVPEARGLRAERFVTIEYATYADGMQDRAQTARVRVQVTPLPSAQRVNQAPVARSFSATVTAGDPLTMTVPTFGVDPDGDSVSVTGIVGADGGAVDLTHGRVVAIGPSTIRYEAFPLAAGTEVISYEVRDRFGATSRAFVRVGVVQPGDPQPPVAVDDEVRRGTRQDGHGQAAAATTSSPAVTSSTSTSRRLNDATRKLWVDRRRQHGQHQGARRHHRACTSSSTASATASSTPPRVGADPSRSRATSTRRSPSTTWRSRSRARPPPSSTPWPTTPTSTPTPPPCASSRCSTPRRGIEAGRVRVRILDHPYAVPYVIEDDDGARAMALIYVPTGANGQPFVVERQAHQDGHRLQRHRRAQRLRALTARARRLGHLGRHR